MDQLLKKEDRKPNIILILADDMGFSDIGCFGGEIKTPNLDLLSSNGIRMSQFYNTARCCPSRASLLTGLNPHQAGIGHMIGDYGIDGYRGYINDSSVTIAEILSNSGYRTQMSGKWHVGGSIEKENFNSIKNPVIPTTRGFDYFFGTLSGGGNYYNPKELMNGETFIDNNQDDFYYTDEITNHAVKMIEESCKDSKPFFSYVAYTAPHWPLHAREEDIADYEDKYLIGWDKIRQSRHETLKSMGILSEKWDISIRDESSPPWEDVQNKIWESQKMATYAAQVNSLDKGVGKIVEELKRNNIFENTLLIFLSDNGGCAEYLYPKKSPEDIHMFDYKLPDGSDPIMGNVPDLKPGPENTFQSYDLPWANVSNSPFRYYKHWIHEGGISSPCVIHWSEKINKPFISDEPVQLMDLTATIIDAAGAIYPKEFNDNQITECQGESFLKIFDQNDWKKSQPLFWEHEGNCAIRIENWKLVKTSENDWELYNLEEDRTESDNLASKEPNRVKIMANKWHKWAKRSNVENWPVENVNMGAAPINGTNIHGVR